MEKVCKNVLSKITELYIVIMIILFPLIVDSTGFFKILECKYKYFLIIGTLYFITNFITILYFSIFKDVNIFKEFKLKKIHLAAILFWGINILSTLLSPFLKYYNLMIGTGRAEGLLTISFYILIFLNITLFGNFSKKQIRYFSISSIFFSLICILQYIGFNPLNMYQDGIGTHNVSFIGTIGNIAFVSAYYTIVLTISMAAYIFIEDNTKFEKIVYMLSICMGFFIFEILDILSGAVAFLGILILFIPFIITNSKRLSKILVVGALILLGYFINLFINPVYHYDLGKLIFEFQINTIGIFLFVFVLLFLMLSYILNKRDFDLSNNKVIIKGFYISLLICVLIGIICLYFIDFKSGFLYEIHELLHGNFDDDFGTYRIFLWRRSFEIFKDYPILGTGPDTFAIRFMERYTEDIASIGELTINDTAANSYITILVNLGILGLLTYLLFLAIHIYYNIRYNNKYSIVLFIAFVCYLIQDCFNLWVVIVTPIFWILMALMYLSLKSNNKEI